MKRPPADNAAAEGIASPARPRVGLALGSRSARGLAHIGALRALEEAGIGIDVIAGTSMGALIGAIYAAGKLDGLAARFLDFDWKGIVSLLDPVFPRPGLIDGQTIADFVRAHVTATRIEHLPIPFQAVATDITNGEQVALGTGDLIEAVRANGRTLVDGGLVNPVPVSVARGMGANLVIAVDLDHDVVIRRLSHPQRSANGKSYAQAVARMLESLVLEQFSTWLHQEPRQRPVHEYGGAGRGNDARQQRSQLHRRPL